MARHGIARRFPVWWYQQRLALPLWPLLPLSWLFRLIGSLRRTLYRHAFLPVHHLSVPVIVVGNLTVGGSGKTPLVLWLVQRLQERGWHPGILSRGYGGTVHGEQEVRPDSESSLVGDEALLLARRSGVPVFVGRDRVAAANGLLATHPDCNLLVADDGLQHYRLQRDVEIVVFDDRGCGNGRLLPAGPLREPLHRLATVSTLVWHGTRRQRLEGLPAALPRFSMHLVGQRFSALRRANASCAASDLYGRRLHAIAGIGDPPRFFSQLRALGLDFEEHPFPDHHAYTADDLVFADNGVLLMTEKDAVKCASLVTGEAWVLPVEAVIEAPLGQPGLVETILELLHGRTPAGHSGLPDLQVESRVSQSAS